MQRDAAPVGPQFPRPGDAAIGVQHPAELRIVQHQLAEIPVEPVLPAARVAVNQQNGPGGGGPAAVAAALQGRHCQSAGPVQTGGKTPKPPGQRAHRHRRRFAGLDTRTAA